MLELIRGMEQASSEEVSPTEVHAAPLAKEEVVMVGVVQEDVADVSLVKMEEGAPPATPKSPSQDRPTPVLLRCEPEGD